MAQSLALSLSPAAVPIDAEGEANHWDKMSRLSMVWREMRSSILTASCVPRVSPLCSVQEEPCVPSRGEPRHWPYLSLAAGDKWRRTQQPLLSLSHSFRVCFQGAGVIFSQQSTGSWCHLRVEAGLASIMLISLLESAGWVSILAKVSLTQVSP